MRASFLIGFLTLLLHGEALPQFTETRLFASDGVRGDGFGASVSISGNYAIIGASFKNSAQGAAYVFKRSPAGWVQQSILTATDGVAGDGFGITASLAGDRAIIGATHVNGGTGAVYIFALTQGVWKEEARLTASDGQSREFLGSSVAISGDYALAGARTANGSAGAVYVFMRTAGGWLEQTKLVASDAAPFDVFGWYSSLSGDFAIIGAYGKDNRKGAAYVFERTQDTWIERVKLTAPDGVAGDQFGVVNISGKYAIVGAPTHNSRGAAYLYEQTTSGWRLRTKLTSTDPNAGDFGIAVAVSETHAIVGADFTDILAGAAFVFQPAGSRWNETAKLTASDRQIANLFGNQVSISGNAILVGTPNGIVNGVVSGVVYVYENSSTSVKAWDQLSQLPSEILLEQNYPNPFNPSTQISFALPQAQKVTLKVFDLTGKEVATLLQNVHKPAGAHEVIFAAGQLASGVYLYRLQAGEWVETKRMVLIR
ncbi:T9SS type A sorting domain-containing protein [bacterium]|nr:T9SS type A sorting domain-containing protein [bacterium]